MIKRVTTGVLLITSTGIFCTPSDSPSVSGPQQQCTANTHKDYVVVERSDDLPGGFLVFDRDTVPGLLGE